MKPITEREKQLILLARGTCKNHLALLMTSPRPEDYETEEEFRHAFYIWREALCLALEEEKEDEDY